MVGHEYSYLHFRPEQLYVGGKEPENLEDFVKKLQLQTGVSAPKFSKDRRKNAPVYTKGGLVLTPEHATEVLNIVLHNEQRFRKDGKVDKHPPQGHRKPWKKERKTGNS
jgi:hypothetical protein